jgi:hypothetical protein
MDSANDITFDVLSVTPVFCKIFRVIENHIFLHIYHISKLNKYCLYSPCLVFTLSPGMNLERIAFQSSCVMMN